MIFSEIQILLSHNDFLLESDDTMKILNDTSVFDEIPGEHRPLGRTKQQILLRCRSFVEEMHNLFVDSLSEEELIRCEFVFRVGLLPGARFRRTCQPFLGVEFIESGSLYYRQEHNAYELSAGDVFLFQPGRDGEFYAREAECTKISFVLSGPLLGEYLRRSGLTGDTVALKSSRKLFSVFKMYQKLAGTKGRSAEQKNGLLAWQLLSCLREAQPPVHPPGVLQQFPAYCLAHLREEITVRDMAQNCGLSVSHFVHLCRKHYGMPPHRYLIMLRMTEAERLLLKKQYSVKEICMMTGYQNPLNFSTEFRKYHGISPRRYAEDRARDTKFLT